MRRTSKKNFGLINFFKVKREIHVGANPGTKYLAVIDRKGTITNDDVADQIADLTTVSEADIAACVIALEQVIANNVAKGFSVKLDKLGTFIPCIKCKTQDTLEKVTADTITRVYCGFNASQKFKATLFEAKKEWNNKVVTGKQDPA
jgi:predicted histone-like DNA-binding protein